MEQEKALNLSETFDYSKLFNKWQKVDSEDLGKLDVWIYYINNETLDFIESYALLHNNTAHIILDYSAWVYDYTGIQITNTSHVLSIKSDGKEFVNTTTSPAIISNTVDRYSSVFTYNQTSDWFNKEENDFNRTYIDSGYIVIMKRKFSNAFGYLGASISVVNQILIFDNNHTILNIFYGMRQIIS